MSLRIRRGTEAQRTGLGYTFDSGELIYTTDTKKLYIGDGVTIGGTHVLASSAGPGLYWNGSTQQLEISGSNLTTAYVQEDPTNLYHTADRAQDAAAILFTHGDGHSGISFIYDDVNNKIYATVSGGGGGTVLPGNSPGFLYNDGFGLLEWTQTLDISTDLTPTLGGDLTLNSHDITGVGNINMLGNINMIGAVTCTNIVTPDISNTQLISITGSNAAGSQVVFNTIAGRDAETTIFAKVNQFRSIELRAHADSITTPGMLETGDILGTFEFTGVMPTTSISSHFGMQVDPVGTVTSTHIPTKFFFITQPDNPGGWKSMLVFDSKGRLGVDQEIPEAKLDVNGLIKLKVETEAPLTPLEGMIAIADRVTWDPATKGTGGSYPVYYDGTSWIAMI